MTGSNPMPVAWKLLLLLLLMLVIALALWIAACCDDGGGGGGGGGGQSLVGGGWGNFQGMATTNYYGMFHGYRGTAYGEVESRVGAAGALTSFAASITTAPPTGSWNFTLFKNGAAQGMTCSISGANTGCLDAAGCVDLAAGDEIAVQVVPTGASANAGGPRWTAVFTAGASCP
jgi:hypothetical protein